MGAVKQWMIEQHERERHQEVSDWLRDRLGRTPTEAEIAAGWAEFELEEAYSQDMDKDD